MKKKEGKHPSTERWLLSYADFITLLMIFFIVMYASSNIDADKYKAITQSLGISLGGSISILDSGDGTLNISYLADFNLDAYYGIQADWKIGKNFILNSGLRFNSTIEKNNQGFKKSNPILFSIGTGF